MLALLIYVVLTCVLTYPTVPRFSRTVAGCEALDSLQYTWSLWWSAEAWQAGHSPAQVSAMYHPWGGQNPLLDVTPLLDWMAYPLEQIISPTEVYNLLFLSSFVLTALSMYLLAYDLTRKTLPAFLAGAVWAFYPNRMGHALSGHLTQLASWWFPLYAMALLHLFRQPNWRNTLLSGLLLALSLYVALVQTAYFVAPFTALVVVACLVAERKNLSRQHWLSLAGAFVLALLLVLPKYGPFLWRALQTGKDLSASGTAAHSTDLLALVLPSPYHPLWGHHLRHIPAVARIFPEPNELEHTAYLGAVVLGLALVALARRQRRSGIWAFVALVSLLLSLGPYLMIGAESTGWPLPYRWLARVPFYGWGRTPERFNQITMFCLAILAAQGLAALRLDRATTASLVFLALVDLIIIWPLPLGTARPPAFLANWRESQGVVLDLPIQKRQIGNLAMYYQTAHTRPIVGGYIHRDLPGMREYVKAIDAALTAQAKSASRPLSAEETQGLLAGLNIQHVLLHRQFVKPEWVQGQAQRLSIALGAPVAEASTVLAYDVPTVSPPDVPEELGRFDDLITLQRLDLNHSSTKPGQIVTVTLQWACLERPATDYTVFVHLLDAGGARVVQHDGQPLGGNWPTSLWAPQTWCTDQHSLRIPEAMPAGRYDLAIGLYAPTSGERLNVASDVLLVQSRALVATDLLTIEDGDHE